jgi:predicted acyltransferase
MAGSGRERILAIDVVRGLAVVGMLLVNNAGIPAAMPQELRHAAWQGLTLADQVFPLFLFSVGASMPFSRRAQRPGAVLRRVVVLFLLGCLLVSAKHLRLAPSTGVLQQIAGAYLLAWALLRLPRRAQLPATALLLAGLWAAFTFVPASWRREGWVHRVITQGQIRSARSPAPRHLNTRSI